MESPPRKLPPKKDVLDAFLGNGSARIFLDPRRPGVVVPKWFAKQPELVLRVGYTLSPPIPDLVVSDEAVSCTLSFNRAPFWCKMPWNAVFAVVSDVDGRGVVWPDDVPVESQLLKPQRPKPKLASVGPKEDRPAAAASPGATDEEGAEPTAAATTTGSDSNAPPPPAVAPTEQQAGEDAGLAAKEPGASPSTAPSTSEPGSAEPEPEKEEGKKPKRQLPPYLRVVK